MKNGIAIATKLSPTLYRKVVAAARREGYVKNSGNPNISAWLVELVKKEFK